MRRREAEPTNILTPSERVRLRALLDAIPVSTARRGDIIDEPATLRALDYYHELWGAWLRSWQSGGAERPPKISAYRTGNDHWFAMRDGEHVIAELRELTV